MRQRSRRPRFSLSGIPYWTVTSGASPCPAVSRRDPRTEDVEEWRELNRAGSSTGRPAPHPRPREAPKREMWEIARSRTRPTSALESDRLRYRMLPYLYRCGGGDARGGLVLRPLVMDFPNDGRRAARRRPYLFGPAFLVSRDRVQGRAAVRPADAGPAWYDFWTGAAARRADDRRPAPYDQMPLHVAAGSIVPFGPELQGRGKPADPVTLFVYAGPTGLRPLRGRRLTTGTRRALSPASRSAGTTRPARSHGSARARSRGCSRSGRSKWCGSRRGSRSASPSSRKRPDGALRRRRVECAGRGPPGKRASGRFRQRPSASQPLKPASDPPVSTILRSHRIGAEAPP